MRTYVFRVDFSVQAENEATARFLMEMGVDLPDMLKEHEKISLSEPQLICSYHGKIEK